MKPIHQVIKERMSDKKYGQSIEELAVNVSIGLTDLGLFLNKGTDIPIAKLKDILDQLNLEIGPPRKPEVKIGEKVDNQVILSSGEAEDPDITVETRAVHGGRRIDLVLKNLGPPIKNITASIVKGKLPARPKDSLITGENTTFHVEVDGKPYGNELALEFNVKKQRYVSKGTLEWDSKLQRVMYVEASMDSL